MSEKVPMHLIVAAFDEQSRAEEAVKTLKESRDEKLVGVQAAVALRKDEAGQIHFKDVGLTPAKGVAGGVVLGAVIGILTGGGHEARALAEQGQGVGDVGRAAAAHLFHVVHQEAEADLFQLVGQDMVREATGKLHEVVEGK